MWCKGEHWWPRSVSLGSALRRGSPNEAMRPRSQCRPGIPLSAVTEALTIIHAALARRTIVVEFAHTRLEFRLRSDFRGRSLTRRVSIGVLFLMIDKIRMPHYLHSDSCSHAQLQEASWQPRQLRERQLIRYIYTRSSFQTVVFCRCPSAPLFRP